MPAGAALAKASRSAVALERGKKDRRLVARSPTRGALGQGAETSSAPAEAPYGRFLRLSHGESLGGTRTKRGQNGGGGGVRQKRPT